MTATFSISIAETPAQPANPVKGNTRFFRNQTCVEGSNGHIHA